jgi:hypothetical protein
MHDGMGDMGGIEGHWHRYPAGGWPPSCSRSALSSSKRVRVALHDLASGTLREKACAVAHCTAGDVSWPQAAWRRRESTSRWMLADIGFCLIFSKSRRRGPRLTEFLFR